MNKIQRIGIAISCFMPLYIILAFKNILKIVELISVETDVLDWKDFDFLFNVVVLLGWIVFVFWGIIAIIGFKKGFLAAHKKLEKKL